VPHPPTPLPPSPHPTPPPTPCGPQVFRPFPELFGADSPAQRVRWGAELAWAWAAVATRCYGGRGLDAPGAQLIPMLDLLNHQNAGSLSGINGDSSTPGRVVGYHKVATMAYKQVRAAARAGEGGGRGGPASRWQSNARVDGLCDAGRRGVGVVHWRQQRPHMQLAALLQVRFPIPPPPLPSQPALTHTLCLAWRLFWRAAACRPSALL
jgi:hypothetical protein